MAEVPSYFQRTRVNERVEAIIELSLHTYGLKVHVSETSFPLQQQCIRLESASALMNRTDGVDGRIAWNDALAFHSISIIAFKPFHWLLRENIGTKKVCSDEELGPSSFVCSTFFPICEVASTQESMDLGPSFHSSMGGSFFRFFLFSMVGFYACIHRCCTH